MSSVQSTSVNTSTGSGKMLRAMVGIGTFCGLLIVLAYEGTFSRIAFLQEEALKAAIFQVLPGSKSTQTFALTENGLFEAASGKDETSRLVYAGYNEQGDLTGVAVEASGQGYGGVIRVLYGYDPKVQKIVGFYVLQSNETPGLGDKIEKDPKFLANFDALDASLSQEGVLLNNIISVKSGTKKNAWEVDAITGATISSRAIADLINASAGELVPLIFKDKDLFIKSSI